MPMLFGNLHILRLIFLLSYIFRLKMNTNDLCRIVAVPANLIFRNPFSQQSTFHGTIPVYAMISSTNFVFHQQGSMLDAEKKTNVSYIYFLDLMTKNFSNIQNKKCVSHHRFYLTFQSLSLSISASRPKKRMKTNRGRNCRRKEDICVNLENRCTTTTTLAEDLIRNWLG